MQVHFGYGNMSGISSLSSYASRLLIKDCESYFNKLILSNGIQLPDLCIIVEWIEDVSKWPNIQWPD